MKYCAEIIFKDFILQKDNEELSIFHTHIMIYSNEIELRVFYLPNVNFDTQFHLWLYENDSKNLFNFSSNTIITKNDNELLGLSISGCNVKSVKNGSNQYTNDLKYVSILIDKIILYKNLIPELIDTGDIYLSNSGFDIVSDFYTPFSNIFGEKNEFKILRRNGKSDFYQINNSKYRPEFNFSYVDNKENKKTTIEKEPMVTFQFENSIEEVTAIQYVTNVLLLLSFYSHSEIEYSVMKLYLKDKTIYIKNTKTSGGNISNYNKRQLGFKDIDTFLKQPWDFGKINNLKNIKRIKTAIHKFNQAIMVDGSSRFLLRFNVLELCMAHFQQEKIKFTKTLNKESEKEYYDKALKVLLDTVLEIEHKDFLIKWESVIKKLEYKPMNSTIEDFLSLKGFLPSSFIISIKSIKKIRDDLTHGSTTKVKSNKLIKANNFLYWLNIALISDLMGLSAKDYNQQLNSKLSKNN